ncbi:MAG: adenine phosphoribosyltransferase [Janthinobacterium lividum]
MNHRADVRLDLPDRLTVALEAGVRDVADFPRPGIVFKDITPLLADPVGFATVVEAFAALARSTGASAVAGVEARGFVFAAPVATLTGLPFWPVRKAGKLPGAVLRREYALEYGTAALELNAGVVSAGQRVLLIDDVLATGGTARAACELLEEAGAEVVALAVLLELALLAGREQLGGRRVEALGTD